MLRPRKPTGYTPPSQAGYYGSLHLVDLSAGPRHRRGVRRRTRIVEDASLVLRSYGRAVGVEAHDDRRLLGIDLVIDDGRSPAPSDGSNAATPRAFADFASRYSRVVVLSRDKRLVPLVQALRVAGVHVVVAVPGRLRPSGPLGRVAAEVIRFRNPWAVRTRADKNVRLRSARPPPLLLDSAHEVGCIRSERESKLGDGVEARVSGSAFERADVGPVDPGAERQVLLRHQ